MDNFGTTHPLAILFDSQKEIASWERVQVMAVQRCRDLGISWAEIAQTLGVTKQAAQQRFAKLVSPDFLDEWERVEAGGKLIYWRRPRSDKSYLTVHKDGGRWAWAHRFAGPEGNIAEGTAGTVAAAKRAAEAAVVPN